MENKLDGGTSLINEVRHMAPASPPMYSGYRYRSGGGCSARTRSVHCTCRGDQSGPHNQHPSRGKSFLRSDNGRSADRVGSYDGHDMAAMARVAAGKRNSKIGLRGRRYGVDCRAVWRRPPTRSDGNKNTAHCSSYRIYRH